MQQLTNIDARWIKGESAKASSHVANLSIFDKPGEEAAGLVEKFPDHP